MGKLMAKTEDLREAKESNPLLNIGIKKR